MTPVERTGTARALVAGLVERLTVRLTADGAPPRLIVGLTGAPGSGKSTLVERIGAELAARELLAGCVPMDGFHMSGAVLAELGRRGRKGAPDTFDVAGYIATLDRVRGPDEFGLPAEVLAPVYRRDLHEPVAAGTRVTGSGVVLTEGNYLALESGGCEGVRTRIDLLVMIDVAQDELIRRLIARHKSFGRSHVAAAHWVRAVDVPNARLVAASADRCDELWRLEPDDDQAARPPSCA